MPVIRATEGVVHEIHGATFTAYANSSTGSSELCAWNLRIPPNQPGTAHRISREELFLVIAGTPRMSLDGEEFDLAAGDVAVAPAGSLLEVTNPGPRDSAIWVTAGTGLSATMADGSRLTPPWAR